ncbi:hypothetical protein [Bacillus subtilis]|uniref:hypothetical protein n=1 Tax=Bacillus subtilis TaxID=1423 RepID=UPI00089DE505|nr:hypothetical protein [Bacillus subtilis]AOY06235.1 hypothetical protein BKN48_13395 [Bacillus subtilis]
MATQPTNAGIDFQQRVSAWILINMAIEMDLSLSLDAEKEAIIKKVELESDDEIDDLVVTLLDDRKMYFQMKRTVSLTQSENSDFYKALSQFIKSFSNDSDSASSYVLVTSSKASSPIKEHLRKIFNSVRLNPLTFLSNPLTQSEKDSFDKFKKLSQDIFEEVNGKQMTEEEFLKLLTKVYIVVLDIEDGMPFEKVVLLTIHNHINAKTPHLFWSFTIKSALSFASQRQSILKEELINNWKHLLKIDSNDTPYNNESIIDEYLKYEIMNGFSMGKDIVLSELITSSGELPFGNEDENEELNLDADKSLFILELFRFNDDGTKRLDYSGEEFLTLKNGLKFKVLRRTATNFGMERFLNENADLISSKKVVVLPANDIESVEQEQHVKIYAEQCKTYIENNSSLNCIHCGRGISQNDSYIIEVDYLENYPMIGIVHDECICPLDRILGIIKSDLFDEYYFLNNFDYKKWLECIIDSQAFISGVENMSHSGLINALWNPYNYPNDTFKYCIKITLKNGDFRYSKIRGKVERLNKSESKKNAKYFNEQIEKLKDKDPWCYTSKNSAFGTYSQLVRLKKPDEDILECESAEVVNYTDHIGKQHNENKNYYAPLCTITLLENDTLFTINSCPILISNPFELKHYLDNWEEAGIEVENYEVNIISTDLEFDNFMRDVAMNGLTPIINPILDRSQDLVRGILVQNINGLQGRTIR